MIRIIVKNFSTQSMLLGLSLSPLVLTLLYLCLFHTDINYLQTYDIDEHAFLSVVFRMYDSLLALDIEGIFSIGFFTYGFLFFALNLLAIIPMLAAGDVENIILIPRLITATFALISMVFVYAFSRAYLNRLNSILVVLLYLTMPGFWANAIRFHPNWMMVCFMMGSLYFFQRDNFLFRKHYWIGVLFIGFSLCTKIQTMIFYPYLFFYVFQAEIFKGDFSRLIPNIIRMVQSVVLTISLYVFVNPFVLHPKGMKAVVHSFGENMKSNSSNHGIDGQVSFMDKFHEAIVNYYFVAPVFLLFILALLICVGRSVIQKKPNVPAMIGLFGIINLTYLLFLVNKSWQSYYLPVFMCLGLMIPALIKQIPQWKTAVLVGIIGIQVFTYYDYQSLRPFTYSLTPHQSVANEITTALQGHIEPGTEVVISPYTGFEFNNVGVPLTKVHIIWGALKEDYLDREGPLLFILRKDDRYFDSTKLYTMVDRKSYQDAAQFIHGILSGKNDRFQLLAETEHLYIWKVHKLPVEENHSQPLEQS